MNGNRTTITFLAALLATSVLLAVGTIRAHRDASRASDRALSHIAALTAWEFAQHVGADLNSSAQISSWYARRVVGRAVRDTTAPLPPPDSIFAASAALRCAVCPPRLRGDSYATLRVNRGSELRLYGRGWHASDSAALRALARRMMQPFDVTRSIGADSVGPWVIARSERADDGTLLLAQVARDSSAVPVALYALLISTVSTDSLFRRTARRTPLLPATVARIETDSLVRILVSTPGGAPVFTNDARDSVTRFTGEAAIRGVASGLIVRSTLTRHASVVVGELSGSNSAAQPYVMLALAVMLTIAAAWHIRRRAELERARTEFIASVSHELQTPLSLVTAYTETMLLGRTRDADEQHRFLGVILREARRLTRLVDNILRFSSDDRHATALVMTRLDLSALAAQACVEFEPVARARDMTLRINCSHPDASGASVGSAPTTCVSGDRDALRQVILNVLDNAVKYGPAGQSIDVCVTQSRDDVVLTIDDEGPGIPPNDREQVFHRFVRLASALDAGARSGSGIGLAIVRDIVTRHGARVALDDAPRGKGLRVTLVFRHVP